MSEHFHPWVDDLGASGFAYATIAAMAQATERARYAASVPANDGLQHDADVVRSASAPSSQDCQKTWSGSATGCRA